ncbi:MULTISPECIES: hypothetical protein [unclassified Herbaspirillum]|uniref:hypothetical protein n=1 Tax=unclassified Herbaspirillum TaxID=2624150 RepID=UPI001E5D3314|nr:MULTISPECIES: hypothetical protein [unclassified Herbaspirillum]
MSTLKNDFGILRRLVVLCEKNTIRVRDLSRFPLIINTIPTIAATELQRERLILILDRLLQSKDQLGFHILDGRGIAKLAELFATSNSKSEDEDSEQVAYIPPRIYLYTLNRQRECIDDFLANKGKIAKCFQFCLDSYIHNYGTLKDAIEKPKRIPLPFSYPGQRYYERALRTGTYQGSFRETARKFEIEELLEKWISSDSEQETLTVNMFSSYLSLINSVCLPYLGAFTFQRKEEIGSLRADCLIWEQDPIVGPIPLICGETTKTDPDSDARWPTSPHVVVAVEAAKAVAHMRLTCVLDKASKSAKSYLSNPHLFFHPTEPWSASRNKGKISEARNTVEPYADVVNQYKKLFDREVLRITEADLTLAKMFTPNLHKKGAFAIGKIWPLSYHQLRRTGGINMFASGLVSDTSVQVILKHLTIFQTRYYGKHFSSARINQSRQQMVVSAAYLVLAKQIQASVEARYISASGAETEQDKDVHLIYKNDYKKLEAAARKGEVAFRSTTLGGCTKRSECDYGGIESIARCVGGDGKKPCESAKLDQAKRAFVIPLLASFEDQVKEVAPDTKRHKALQMEINGLRTYLELTAI